MSYKTLLKLNLTIQIVIALAIATIAILSIIFNEIK